MVIRICIQVKCTCALHSCLFYCTKIILKLTIIIEAHCKDCETEVYKNLILLSSHAQMALVGTGTSLHPSAPYKVPCQSGRPVGFVWVPALWAGLGWSLWGLLLQPQVAGEGAGGCRLALACLTSSFPASHCLLPRNSELKAQPGSAHWEGMETCRLSFTEITWRGPRLADGVWVPVVPAGLPGWL